MVSGRLVKDRLFIPILVLGIDINELYEKFLEQYSLISDSGGGLHLCVHFPREKANRPSVLLAPTPVIEFYFYSPLMNGEENMPNIEHQEGYIATFIVEKIDMEFLYQELCRQKRFCEDTGKSWFEFIYFDDPDKPFIVVQPTFGQEYIFMTKAGI